MTWLDSTSLSRRHWHWLLISFSLVSCAGLYHSLFVDLYFFLTYHLNCPLVLDCSPVFGWLNVFLFWTVHQILKHLIIKLHWEWLKNVGIFSTSRTTLLLFDLEKPRAKFQREVLQFFETNFNFEIKNVSHKTIKIFFPELEPQPDENYLPEPVCDKNNRSEPEFW